ncbi:MAG: helix-turn-helix transcriptional regulator [Lachnospiraceae bacterium]|nr:helix-turn-helix transcriptional regulator [Lachnospiraceae bacterium]
MRDNHIRILCSVLNVDIVYETADGSLTAFFDNSKESPLMQSQALRQIMREGTAAQSSIFLRHNTYDCYFAGLHAGDGYIYMGPMAHQRLTSAQRRRMYRAYGIDSEDLPVLPVFTLPQIRNMALLANTVLENASLENEELLQLNRIITKEEKQIQQEQTAFTMREEEVDDDEAYRHSYHEEQLVLQAVREGRAEDAIRISEDMDRDSGRLARTDIRHRRYVAIIGITLCSRAAIEGGVSPASVYRISGYYINKCDETEDPAHMLLYRNRAIEELAGRVREGLNAPRGSSYVERCRDYIRKHYRDKIYLEDIAQALDLSPSYLSRLYRRETGGCIQDAINEERVYRASNLLRYSDMSLTQIAHYVGFPSQSYMGKIFKKWKNMTPMAYRETFKRQGAEV